MDTGNILAVLGIVATLVAGFAAWKFIVNKKNKTINQSDGETQIAMMDSSNNTVNVGDKGDSKKQD